jgi:hypothetical protein
MSANESESITPAIAPLRDLGFGGVVADQSRPPQLHLLHPRPQTPSPGSYVLQRNTR